MGSRVIGEQGVHLLNTETGRTDFLAPGTKVTDAQAARLGPHVFEDYDPDDDKQRDLAVNGPKAPAADAAAAGSSTEPEVRVVVSPIPGDTDAYEALTVPDLKAIADARGIEVSSSANKPDIIDAILDADDELYAALSALAADADGLAGDLNGGAPAGDGGAAPDAATGDGAAAAQPAAEGTGDGAATQPPEPKAKGGGKNTATS